MFSALFCVPRIKECRQVPFHNFCHCSIYFSIWIPLIWLLGVSSHNVLVFPPSLLGPKACCASFLPCLHLCHPYVLSNSPSEKHSTCEVSFLNLGLCALEGANGLSKVFLYMNHSKGFPDLQIPYQLFSQSICLRKYFFSFPILLFISPSVHNWILLCGGAPVPKSVLRKWMTNNWVAHPFAGQWFPICSLQYNWNGS